MTDLFADPPPTAPAAPPRADRARAATLTPPQPLSRPTGRMGERQVRLPDGRWVSNWSEAWRALCEVRFILSLPGDRREAFMAGITKFRGEEGHAALRHAVCTEAARLDRAALDLLALPDKAARVAALDVVEAEFGPVERKAQEAAVWARWQAGRRS